MKVRKRSIKVKPGQKEVTMPSGRKLSVPNGCRSMFFTPYQFNDTDAFIPEIWALEAVRILYEEMLYPATIHTDFNDDIARMGDVVHTRKPGELVAKRKQNDLDALEDQDVSATDILVKLNQRPYVSILIGDAEESLSMQSLIETYLVHEMQAQARFLDQVVGSQVYQFLNNVAGGLGTLTANNSHDYLLDTREVMNNNKVTPDNRWLGLTSASETFLQKNTLFKEAQKIGDAGQALRNALLGRVAGFNTFLELNTPSIRGAVTTTTTTINNAGGYPAGTTTFIVASGAVLATGEYITIAGDMTPLRVTNIATNTITVNRPLRYPVANSAVVTPYETALVNQSSAIAAAKSHGGVANGYPLNWMKPIAFDGAATPKVGQLVSFKSGGTVLPQEYAVVQVSGSTILLDQPLENNIADDAVIDLGPNGDYNWAYQRAAVTLVNRAMKLPMGGAGARADRASFKGMSMNVKISYDDVKEGHRVVVTGLFGVKKLETLLGAVMLG